MPSFNITNKDYSYDSDDTNSFPLITLIVIIPCSIAILCLCHVCCEGIYSDIKNRNINRTYYSDNSSFSSYGSGGSYYREPATIEIKTHFSIKEMNRFIITEINKEEIKDFTCAICINDYLINEEIIKFDCSHDYHKDCIRPWLIEKINTQKVPQCPLCNAELIVEYIDNENSMKL
jgi:hypothetical protein